ncbi:MAG: 3-deoxy-D-manno-octulosonic acid transferase, partial [Mucilaginibacter sp.]
HPDWKFIIAPHEISEEKINKLISILPDGSATQYSKIPEQDSSLQNQTLIIDNIGMLSSLYQYGRVAYIGGGFGVGIHNTLEAAAFGLPVIFGPNYQRFKEARELVSQELGFSIKDAAELESAFSFLTADESQLQDISKKVRQYVSEHTGATEMIMEYIITVLR